jgi:hypothetical protein
MNEELPILPGCSLDDGGTRSQRERYRVAGIGARVLDRDDRHFTVLLDRRTDADLVERAIAIERDCCPFFILDWERTEGVLTVGVECPEHAPALEAIASALGLPPR